MSITLISFGYRYGRPEADITINAKALPNPWCVHHLRKLRGTDWKVQDYVVNSIKGKDFIDKAFNNIVSKARKQRSVIIAIGCIGGKHRSVAVVCELQDKLVKFGIDVTVQHRDIKRR